MIAIEAVIGISLTMVDCENQPRRGGRVAEGGGLLNRCTVKSCTGGSNPPLSATQSALQRILPAPRLKIQKFGAFRQVCLAKLDCRDWIRRTHTSNWRPFSPQANRQSSFGHIVLVAQKESFNATCPIRGSRAPEMTPNPVPESIEPSGF